MIRKSWLPFWLDRLLIAGVELPRRAALNLIGFTAVDNAAEDRIDVTASATGNVVASGTFTMSGGAWITVTPSAYQAGDCVAFTYQSGDDSSPNLIIVQHLNATQFQAGTSSMADAATYAYKVIR